MPHDQLAVGSNPLGYWAFFLVSISLKCVLKQVPRGSAELLIFFLKGVGVNHGQKNTSILKGASGHGGGQQVPSLFGNGLLAESQPVTF